MFEFFQKNKRSSQQLVKYMVDVAMGMHYISERGLVHRVSPSHYEETLGSFHRLCVTTGPGCEERVGRRERDLQSGRLWSFAGDSARPLCLHSQSQHPLPHSLDAS